MTQSVTYPQPPAGLDARFCAVVFTVHCSHCGDAYEGEFGPMRFTADDLPRLAEYGLDESEWIVNIDGLHSDEIGDRKLACPKCAQVGWCEECDEPIRAWQEAKDKSVHDDCVEEPAR